MPRNHLLRSPAVKSFSFHLPPSLAAASEKSTLFSDGISTPKFSLPNENNHRNCTFNSRKQHDFSSVRKFSHSNQRPQGICDSPSCVASSNFPTPLISQASAEDASLRQITKHHSQKTASAWNVEFPAYTRGRYHVVVVVVVSSRAKFATRASHTDNSLRKTGVPIAFDDDERERRSGPVRLRVPVGRCTVTASGRPGSRSGATWNARNTQRIGIPFERVTDLAPPASARCWSLK